MICTTCPRTLGTRNKTGYCVKCWPKVAWTVAKERDPDFEARRIAGIKRSLQENPERLAKMKAAFLIAAKTPHARAMRSAAAKRDQLWKVGQKALAADPTALARRGATLSNTRLAWCPVDMRQNYRDLVRRYKIPAPQAKAMILEEMAAATRRAHGNLAPSNDNFPWGKVFQRSGSSEENMDLWLRDHMREASARLLLAMSFVRSAA